MQGAMRTISISTGQASAGGSEMLNVLSISICHPFGRLGLRLADTRESVRRLFTQDTGHSAI
jgi:hypothetical protein